jgi:hypothetical protein
LKVFCATHFLIENDLHTVCFEQCHLLLFLTQTLEAEVLPWEQKVNAMKNLAQRLIDNYAADDSSEIKTTVNRTENQWSGVLMR